MSLLVTLLESEPLLERLNGFEIFLSVRGTNKSIASQAMRLRTGLSLFLVVVLVGFNLPQGFAQRQGRWGEWLRPGAHAANGVEQLGLYGPSVTEAEVKANAAYMARYMKPYGWDTSWSTFSGTSQRPGARLSRNAELVMDSYGRLLPALNRFPSSSEEMDSSLWPITSIV